jgi:hypothetical protein
MKTKMKKPLSTLLLAMLSIGIQAQQIQAPKQVKVVMKTNDNGKTEMFEANELTPEVEKRLKEAGVNIEELKKGSKVIVHSSKNITDGTSGSTNKKEAQVINIYSGDDKEAEVKILNNGSKTNSESFSFSTSGDEVKVIVNGEEIISGEKDGKSKKVKTIFISTNLTNSTSEELRKAGISETNPSLEIEEVVCMPNPTTGKFKISFKSGSEEAVALEVRDINGKIALKEVLTHSGDGYSKELDLGKEAKGIYFVTISQSGKATTKKLVVN